MTTTTLTLRRNRPPVWLLILALVAVALPFVAISVHASLHEEADLIRQCASDPSNLLQIWINKSLERHNCLIQLPDGRVGDRVMQWCKKSGWIEITAYILGDGSLAEAVRVLKEKACTMIWPLER